MNPIYGPVPSWRLGRSLGIDPICCLKTCSFDCLYCQLGKTTNKTCERKMFVDETLIKKELEDIIDKVDVDVITLSGSGEPTLAKNLSKIVKIVKEVTSLPIAVLTNSSLLYSSSVRRSLNKVDIVMAKLDAPNEFLFKKINKPIRDIKFGDMIEGITKLRNGFSGKFCIQIMFIEWNRGVAKELASLTREIEPDEVQINTPLRPSKMKPLGKNVIEKIKPYFKGLNIVSVYDREKPEVKIVDVNETLMRRPEI